MSRLWHYLTDERVKPNTQTCRIKVWAHDNAFTIVWVTFINAIGWAVTVIQCH
jgi:hypothetical protein